jgi:hypothetical protein
MSNKKVSFIGFNLPSELYKFVQSQLKETYKNQTEYFRDLVISDKKTKEVEKT